MSIENFGWIALILIGVGILIFAIIAFLLYKFQDKIIYVPVIDDIPKSPQNNPFGMRNPKEQGLEYENIEIKTEDGIILRGWIVKSINSTQVPTVLYFHESVENIGIKIYYMSEYTYNANVNIVLIAYRGYSDSEGIPSEEGIKKDAGAMVQHLFSRQDINTSQIFLHGRSLGGAVSIYAASTFQDKKFCGVIIENTFTSISDMSDFLFSTFKFLKKYLLRNFWPSIEIINKIKCPILFIQSMKDEQIPPIHMSKLYEAAKLARFKHLHVIPDGDHMNSWRNDIPAYIQAITTFMKCCQNVQKGE